MMNSKVSLGPFTSLGVNGDVYYVYPEQMKEACSLMEAKIHHAEKGSVGISRETARGVGVGGGGEREKRKQEGEKRIREQ